MRHDWNSLLPEPSHSSLLGIGDSFSVREVPCVAYNATRMQPTAAAAAAAAAVAGPSAAASPVCRAADYSSVDYRFNLFTVGKGLQFREYSREYYPEADRLVDYMHFWPSKEAPRGVVTGQGSPFHARTPRPLNIVYNTTVVRVSRHPDLDDEGDVSPREAYVRAAQGRPRFRVHTASGAVYDCTTLVWAGGLQRTNPPQGENIADAIAKGWVTQYASATTDLSHYVNMSVLIFGRGNAAFEFANNILEVAASVHVLGRDTGRIKLSWETHYPGDVRAVHARLLETYLLKSMDALAEAPFENLHFEFNKTTGRVAITDPYNKCEMDKYGRESNRCFFRREYDRVISCSGWQFEDSPFDRDVRPQFFANKKHPAITPKYESVNVPGLYFAGNLMHAHDFKKSSGGFIHGFRYLVRALHRILEEEEQIAYTTALLAGAPLPTAGGAASSDVAPVAPLSVDTAALSLSNRTVPLPFSPPPSSAAASAAGRVLLPATGWPRRSVTGVRSMSHALLRLINGASGPYQMFGGLGAVVVLPPFSAAQAKGFVRTGVLAACEEPWSFPDPNADTLYLLQQPAPPSPKATAREDAAQAKSDAVIDAAIAGGAVFEDVPVKLVMEKAALWQSQLIAEMNPGAAASGSAATLGVEFVQLTLEFGTGSSSYVPDNKRNIDMKADPVAAMKAKSEWTRDPFSLLRANATLNTPETSHFLHPVLKYYNTALNATHPVAEMHVIEDFHIMWTMHIAHLLPVTRFVQDVGARRAAAALAVAEQNAISRAGSTAARADFAATSAGHVSGPLFIPAVAALTRVWRVPRDVKDHTYDIIEHSMLTTGSTLYFRGKSVSGSEGWFNKLSIAATDELFHTGPRMLLIHFVDPYPIPPTEDEMEYLEATRREVDSATESPSMTHTPEFPPTRPEPDLSPAQQKQMAGAKAFLDDFYASFTVRNPSVALVSINARTGFERIQAERFGVETIPLFKIYDAYRGMIDLPGGDFQASAKQMEQLIATHATGRESLYAGDDSNIFPGYDRKILLRTLFSSGIMRRDMPEMAEALERDMHAAAANAGGPPPPQQQQQQQQRSGGSSGGPRGRSARAGSSRGQDASGSAFASLTAEGADPFMSSTMGGGSEDDFFGTGGTEGGAQKRAPPPRGQKKGGAPKRNKNSVEPAPEGDEDSFYSPPAPQAGRARGGAARGGGNKVASEW
jgi:hypothetical protein